MIPVDPGGVLKCLLSIVRNKSTVLASVTLCLQRNR
jgi:hypothetical protein